MIAGKGWVVGVKEVAPGKWQVFWFDDPTLKTGPYERPALVYEDQESAGRAASRIAKMLGNGSVQPTDAESVVRAATGD